MVVFLCDIGTACFSLKAAKDCYHPNGCTNELCLNSYSLTFFSVFPFFVKLFYLFLSPVRLFGCGRQLLKMSLYATNFERTTATAPVTQRANAIPVYTTSRKPSDLLSIPKAITQRLLSAHATYSSGQSVLSKAGSRSRLITKPKKKNKVSLCHSLTLTLTLTLVLTFCVGG